MEAVIINYKDDPPRSERAALVVALVGVLVEDLCKLADLLQILEVFCVDAMASLELPRAMILDVAIVGPRNELGEHRTTRTNALQGSSGDSEIVRRCMERTFSSPYMFV